MYNCDGMIPTNNVKEFPKIEMGSKQAILQQANLFHDTGHSCGRNDVGQKEYHDRNKHLICKTYKNQYNHYSPSTDQGEYNFEVDSNHSHDHDNYVPYKYNNSYHTYSGNSTFRSNNHHSSGQYKCVNFDKKSRYNYQHNRSNFRNTFPKKNQTYEYEHVYP